MSSRPITAPRSILTLLVLASLAACRPEPPTPPTPQSEDLPTTERTQEGEDVSEPESALPRTSASEIPRADDRAADPPVERPVRRRERRRPVFERGLASWYGPGFHGRRTANGERYDMDGVSAAHKTLPFGTIVEVHNLDNDRRIEVRINDRGPFIKGRIIDLSRGAARRLDLIGAGVARVELRLISEPEERAAGGARQARRSDVQVAAFRQERRARDLARTLRDHRDLERWVEIERSRGWHRVRLIDVPRKHLESALERLRRLGFEPLVLR